MREPCDPVKARQIALHVESVLAQIRDCQTLPQLEMIFEGFGAYAKTMAVVTQIRDHVRTAFNETATVIKARERNAATVAAKTVTDRLTGDSTP